MCHNEGAIDSIFNFRLSVALHISDREANCNGEDARYITWYTTPPKTDSNMFDRALFRRFGPMVLPP